MAMSTFALDPAIFNPTLYTQVTNIWLPGVDMRGEGLDEKVKKNWFTGSPEEREIFDGVCRDNFAHALEAIGPDHFPSPNAQPFIDEIEEVARTESSSQAAWTALSITLLLDQMPRNIFRTDAGLRKVYNHYDVISYSFAQHLLSSKGTISRPDLHPQWRNSTVHRVWFYLPLVHSEKLESHNMMDEIYNAWAKDLETLEGHAASKAMFEAGAKSEKEHREILDKFGRYPHRNAALGRATTEEEKKFLEEGGATFGVAQKKQAEEKQEL